jgi:uncharacterized protein YbjT (DUF2867 family)
MVRIAVAGGAGQVGKAIVEGLVAHSGHEVYVLSRSVCQRQFPFLLVT